MSRRSKRRTRYRDRRGAVVSTSLRHTSASITNVMRWADDPRAEAACFRSGQTITSVMSIAGWPDSGRRGWKSDAVAI